MSSREAIEAIYSPEVGEVSFERKGQVSIVSAALRVALYRLAKSNATFIIFL